LTLESEVDDLLARVQVLEKENKRQNDCILLISDYLRIIGGESHLAKSLDKWCKQKLGVDE
jgi:hypothetical protein